MEFALNAIIHSSHGQLPLKVMFRYELFLPIDDDFSDLCDFKVHAVTEQIQAHLDL